MTHERLSTARIPSVDIVRGSAIVLMALDHVRDFVSRDHFQPEDLSRASAALFATRWVTHFCAPAFFLTAGIGIGLSRARSDDPARLGRFLLTRGLWLLLLDLVVTPIGWQFGFPPIPAFALVLWALGWSMILVALAIRLPVAAVAVLSLALILGHNLLDGIRPDSLGAMGGLWHFLHSPGFAIPGILFIAYPLIPWVGVMGLGYSLATLYHQDVAHRRKVLVWSGLAAIALFVLLRGMNGHGNPFPWSPQRTPALTVASFLNVTKYPPSLQFLAMTLGPIMLALACTERAHGRIAGWLSVYGRVPLFFYVTHIFVAHLAGVLIALVQGGTLMRIPILTGLFSLPDWYGLSLAGVYVAWAIVVVFLYYPCRAFARLKDTRTDWWLRYL